MPSRVFRRSFLIFTAFCLLALALTVGYALTGLSSVNTAIQEAAAAFRQKRYGDCLRILSHAEQGMGPSGWLGERRTMLGMRARCHLRLSNHVMARSDLQRLIDDYGEEDPELARELIRSLILTAEPTKALHRALDYLREYPEDGRTHELAGEALQAIYQEKLSEFLTKLRLWLPPVELDDATEGTLAYLYRPRTDPLSRYGKERLDTQIERFRREEFVSGAYVRDLREIRDLITQAQNHFRKSLELPGTPVSAYGGVAFALKQGKRDDDLIALAETYLYRFDHLYSMTALTDAVRVHWDAGRYRSVVGMVDRFLPPDSWKERLAAKTLSPEIRTVLLLKARSLYALEDLDALVALVAELEEMAKAPKMDFVVEQLLAKGFVLDLQGATWDLDTLLNPLSWLAQKEPKVGDDPLAISMRLRLNGMDRLPRANNMLRHYQRILQAWIRARPNQPEPYLRRAEYLIDFGEAANAYIDAQQLFKLAQVQRKKIQFPTREELSATQDLDEQALKILARAADMAYAEEGRDARAMLQQCRRLGKALPRDVGHPVQYLSLARLALDGAQLNVANAASREAVQAFSWARWPRYLLAEAQLRTGQADVVEQGMDVLLTNHPNDPEALRFKRAARRALGKANNSLLYDVALLGNPDSELALVMTRNSVQRQNWRTARHLAEHAIEVFGTNSEIPLLAATALEGLGNHFSARRALAPWLGRIDELPAELARRFVRKQLQLTLDDKRFDPAKFDPEAAYLDEARLRHRNLPNALYGMAGSLVEHGLWEHAHGLLRPIFEEPKNRGKRTGAHYLLAGRVALRMGMNELAADHLTAAMSFDDGNIASKWLALLLLDKDDLQGAADAFWADQATDQTSAALALRLGRMTPATDWVTATLERNPAHAGALCLRALAGDKDASPDVRALLLNPRLLTEVLLFSEEAEFESIALERAAKLHTSFPGNAMAACLYGRVLNNAGRHDEAIAVLKPKADDLSVFDELVHALAEAGSPELDEPEIKVRMAQVSTEMGDKTPPRLRVQALRGYANTLANHPDVGEGKGLDVLARFWIDHTEDTGAGLPQVDQLIDHQRYAEALLLLEALEANLDHDDRPLFFADYASRADQILRTPADDEAVAVLNEQVDTWLDQHGHFGSLVHLKLDLVDRAHRAAGSPRNRAVQAHIDEEKQLLLSHLAWFRGFADPDPRQVVRSLRRLILIEGQEAVMERIEQFLRWDQSLIELWILRAQLLEEQGRPEEALHGLRWLFDYIDTADVLLEYSRIAAQTGIATREDEDRFLQTLDERFATQGRALFVRGVLAFRMGRYSEAVDFLSKASRRGDGAHLYFQALAHLALREDADIEAAIRLFSEYQEKYGRRGLSEIAGHLASQLSVIDEDPEGTGTPAGGVPQPNMPNEELLPELSETTDPLVEAQMRNAGKTATEQLNAERAKVEEAQKLESEGEIR